MVADGEVCVAEGGASCGIERCVSEGGPIGAEGDCAGGNAAVTDDFGGKDDGRKHDGRIGTGGDRSRGSGDEDLKRERSGDGAAGVCVAGVGGDDGLDAGSEDGADGGGAGRDWLRPEGNSAAGKGDRAGGGGDSLSDIDGGDECDRSAGNGGGRNRGDGNGGLSLAYGDRNGSRDAGLVEPTAREEVVNEA